MKKFSFKWALLLYTTVLGIIIAVLAFTVWKNLDKYQADYDKAKEAGNPDIEAEKIVSGWNYDTVLKYVTEYGVDNVDEYNTPEQLAMYLTTLEGSMSYSENSKSSTTMPVYDIYAGDTRVAAVSLKPEGDNDEFGFHDWQIRDLVFDTDSLGTEVYHIKTINGYKVIVNNTELSEDMAVIQASDSSTDIKAEQLSGVKMEYVTYDLGSCLVKPDITVTDSEGRTVVNYTEQDGVIEYTQRASDEFIQSVENRVLDTCHAYIMNIYSKLSFYQMSKYLEAGSEAYAVVQDVQASIAWGWHPDNVEVLEESVSDFVKYNDTLFSCKYYGKIYKSDADEEYEEIFKYSLLFRKSGEEWYLTYFILE